MAYTAIVNLSAATLSIRESKMPGFCFRLEGDAKLLCLKTGLFGESLSHGSDRTLILRVEDVSTGKFLFNTLNAAIGDSALNDDERTLLREASESFDAFMEIDRRIVENYRTGTPESITAGNDLASGESLEVFGKAATATSDLATKVTARGMTTAASAAESAQTGKQTMILVGAVGLVLSVYIHNTKKLFG